MKTLKPSLGLLLAAFSGLALASTQAFGPYYSPYDGTATVTAGKKKGALLAAATATTTDGTDATVLVSGKGPKGIQVDAQLTLLADGKASLVLSAKVLADPKQALKRDDEANDKKDDKKLSGKKVVVKVKAQGTWTVVDANTVSFTVSGNAGKGGGTNVTGTFATDAVGNLSLTAKSGFKQKVAGVGRRLDFSFAGVSSTTPAMP